MPVRSKKIRDAAKGEHCTLAIPGTCNGNPETVVACHLPPRGETGMSRKGDDHFVAFGCDACHADMDGRTGALKRFGEDWLYFAYRGVYRTQQRLIENGVLVVK